jgi:hypothetical protein
MVTHGSKMKKNYASQTLIDKGISKKYEKKWEFIIDDVLVIVSTD